MFKKSAIVLAVTAALPLSGCLKVEDSDSKETIVIEQSEQTPATVQVVLELVDHASGTMVQNVSARYKVGTQWSDELTVANGQIVIDDLPGNSDVLIDVTSDDGKYVKRIFSFKTSTVTQGQSSVQSLGQQYLYQASVAQFSILDSQNQSVKDVAVSYPIVTYLTNYYPEQKIDNRIVATYNEETGLYSLPLAAQINYQIDFDGDIDNDGVSDYLFGYSSFTSKIYSQELSDADVVYAKKTAESYEFPVNITLLNNKNEPVIDNEALFVTSKYKLPQALMFDAQKNAYRYTYKGSSEIKINFSDIKSNDVNYKAGYVKVMPNQNDIDVNFQNSKNSSRDYSLDELGELNLVILLDEIDAGSNYYFQSLSNFINSEDDSLNLFLSHPVQLSEDSVELENREVITITRGNASDNDMVPPGTTLIKRSNVEQEVNAELLYGNNLLVVTPKQPLTGGSYKYTVRNLKSAEDGTLYSRSFSNDFEIVKYDDEFSIDAVKVDNNNGFSQGQRLVESNSAGIVDNSAVSAQRARLFLPLNMKSLDYLDISVIKSVINNQESELFYRYRLVKDGEIQVSKHFATSLAMNENISNEGYASNLKLYTTLEEGQYYVVDLDNVNYRFDDHTEQNKNSITFNYEYRVKGGTEVISGTKTLNVL